MITKNTIKAINLLFAILAMFTAKDIAGQPAYGTTSAENCYQKVTAGFTGRAKKANFIKGAYDIKIS
jgi:hypothetical protein